LQGLQVFGFFNGKTEARKNKKRDEHQPVQALAFPWFATAAARRAISAGSPR
jgi:hypothetical protein